MSTAFLESARCDFFRARSAPNSVLFSPSACDRLSNLPLAIFHAREGNVGTTKLTRKEILGDDPIHDALVNTIEVVRERGKQIALGAGALILAGFGIYLALEYMERRDNEAQQILTRGIDFYPAQVDPSALDDP